MTGWGEDGMIGSLSQHDCLIIPAEYAYRWKVVAKLGIIQGNRCVLVENSCLIITQGNRCVLVENGCLVDHNSFRRGGHFTAEKATHSTSPSSL